MTFCPRLNTQVALKWIFVPRSHFSTNMQKWESSGTNIYKLSKHYSVTHDYILGNYFKAIQKKAYRGSTDLLQSKNNIKPQNNEKK